jgi:predicted DCC family thiol-disulfide oxidoreductase YuxK
MKDKIRVLYNADCPICNFEIRHYQKYVSKNDLGIEFDDLNGNAITKWNVTPDTAARRLYVSKGTEIKSGLDGFLILWREMPRYRWLFHLIRQPGIKQICSFFYDKFLAPSIYSLHLKRQKITMHK